MSHCTPAIHKQIPDNITPVQVVEDFLKHVNMNVEELESLLASEQSQHVKPSRDMDVRHLARRVIELLGKLGERRDDPHHYDYSLLYDADIEQMYQITQFIECELKEVGGAAEKLRDSESRLFLLHLGFDPMKKIGQSHTC